MENNFINNKFNNLNDLAKKEKNNYINSKPFPHIVIDNLFKDKILNNIVQDFPKNLDKIGNQFNNQVENKLTLNKSNLISENTNSFINFLNSQKFLEFLQLLTNVKETLIPDPYLIGGGIHELRNNGYLNIHADFNLHPTMKLDRRLNILVYLNHNWKEEYGGSLELWDKDMTKCEKKIIPFFNKTVIFSTTDFSYHGNPERVSCPINISRKSLALYYYSNGRPFNERKLGMHSTIFRKRAGTDDIDGNLEFKKLFGKFYIRKKNKI